MAELAAMLDQASPFHHPEAWAVTARYLARRTLDEGRIETFATLVEHLRLALLTLNDARSDRVFERMFYACAGELAETLMYMHTRKRRQHVADAVTLYRMVSADALPHEAERARAADVMSVLGSAIARGPDAELSIGELSEPTRRALASHPNAATLGDLLLDYAIRMSHVARRTDPALFDDALLAADLAQLLVESACVAGGPTFNQIVPTLTRAFRYQLQAQQSAYGYTQERLDEGARRFAALFRRQDVAPPSLVFLRPLATSRRIRLRSAFGPAYADQLAALSDLPSVLTLESALHVAFMRTFHTEALGGPIDLLGMARPTALYESREPGLRAWHDVAALMIEHAAVVLVLLGQTGGLRWEMSELARQGAFGKLVLVTPPAEVDDSVADFVRRMGELGLRLPADVTTPGFRLFDTSGEVRATLPFAALWSGELLAAVSARP
jgi:hypothetical protein